MSFQNPWAWLLILFSDGFRRHGHISFRGSSAKVVEVMRRLCLAESLSKENSGIVRA